MTRSWFKTYLHHSVLSSALSPGWQAILNFSHISIKLNKKFYSDSNILASPEAGQDDCLLSDSFTFVKEVRKFTFSPSSVFLCSFDISSLFTNVPLAETIEICADALYNDDSMAPSFPRNIFVELMQLATSSVEFSFNNNMHRQIDGVAMGSPLGPALANIFVGYQEAKLFNIAKRPLVYFRYVDDTFAVFNNEEDCNNFFIQLNSLHPSLRFTYEKESNHSLPFLDVLVERHDSEFLTSVYRKPTFTGQYLRWNSFSPQKRKINLIGTLVHRAFMICSTVKANWTKSLAKFVQFFWKMATRNV